MGELNKKKYACMFLGSLGFYYKYYSFPKLFRINNHKEDFKQT